VRKEVLIGGPGFDRISYQRISPAQLQVGERADRIADYDSRVIENLLKLCSRCGAPVRDE
jgi:hypothetical protein